MLQLLLAVHQVKRHFLLKQRSKHLIVNAHSATTDEWRRESLHWRRDIPHAPEVGCVEGILPQSTQHRDEHLHKKHSPYQEVHVLLQLRHLDTHSGYSLGLRVR